MKIWSENANATAKLKVTVLLLPIVLLVVIVGLMPVIMNQSEQLRNTIMIVLLIGIVVSVFVLARRLGKQSAQENRVFCFDEESSRLFTIDLMRHVTTRTGSRGVVKMKEEVDHLKAQLLPHLEAGNVPEEMEEIVAIQSMKPVINGTNVRAQMIVSGQTLEKTIFVSNGYTNQDALQSILEKKVLR